MLFANGAVALYINANYECAWESLRPVPKVHIDFGNGHTLDRTLNGNIAFWFVSPKGEAFDLVPGLVDAPTFLSRCREATALGAQLGAAIEPATRRQLVAQVHLRRIAMNPAAPSSTVPDRSKVRVEHGIKDALGVAGIAQQDPDFSQPAGFNPADISKVAVEMPLKSSLLAALPQASLPDASALPVDTAFNQRIRFPKADRLLAQSPLAKPADLTQRVYLDILGVDLADPYLGLAPYLLGGEPGRDGH